MKLIVILICLSLQRYVNINGSFSQAWFGFYLKLLKPLFVKLNKWLSLTAIVLPVIIVLALIHFILLWKLSDLSYVILAAFILFICLDAKELQRMLSPYFAGMDNNDHQSARNVVQPLAEEFSEPLPDDAAKLSRTVTNLIFLKTSQSIFTVLFWFALCDIYGAIFYYMIFLTRKLAHKMDGENLAEAATQVQNVMDWVPARLVGISCALAGHFMTAFTYFYKNIFLGLKENKTFVTNCGLAALDTNQDSPSNIAENRNALSLIDRTIIIWLIATLLITLGSLL